MRSSQDSDQIRRRFLAAGTGVYSSNKIDELKDVPAELHAVQKIFEALGFELEPEARDLKHNELLDRCSSFRDSSLTGDALVAYYTSHGERDGERFFLLTRDTDRDHLDDTAVPAEDLARRLIKGSKARQVLIILDMCYAETGLLDISRLISVLISARSYNGPETYVIAAASLKQIAYESAFAKALTSVLGKVDERVAGVKQPYIQICSLVNEINAILKSQTTKWSCTSSAGECLIFPNPNFDGNKSLDKHQKNRCSFEEHWIPKARSADTGVTGWYFTGRVKAVHQLVAWLNQPNSDGKIRIVTGSAGTGKSALLAWLVTLSDPQCRKEIFGSNVANTTCSTILPEGVVNAAIFLRHKMLTDVVNELGKLLSHTATDAASLVNAIAATHSKTVLIFDALDEADERQPIVGNILRPLGELPHVFLLIGSRPDPQAYNHLYGPQIEDLNGVSVELDLDDPNYGNNSDVAEYILRRLLATEEPGRKTPYQASQEKAVLIAKVLANRIDNSFLVARTVVTTLLAQPEVLDVSRPGWEELLPSGFEEALDQFLQQLENTPSSELNSEVARAVLLPLAFAEGEGIPWERIWAPMASAISQRTITDEQILETRRQASAFIVTALEGGRSVYRLSHERIADALKKDLSQQIVQTRIVNGLRFLVPLRPDNGLPDWPTADPYILSYLPLHAFKARMLEQMLREKDELFLAACDPRRLLSLLSVFSEKDLQPTLETYELAFDNLLEHSIPERFSYLELAARQLGHNQLADAWQIVHANRPWTVPWAHWRVSSSPHRRIQTKSQISTLATDSSEDDDLIVTGGNDKRVRVWDLASGRQLTASQNKHLGRINALATLSINGLGVIISGSDDKTIRIWDLRSCDPIGDPLIGHTSRVTSLAVGSLDGRKLIISGSSDKSIIVWDLENRTPLLPPFKGHTSKVKCVAFASLGGQSVIISGGDDKTIIVWNLMTGARIYDPIQAHEKEILSLATATLNGELVVISGSEDNTIRVWDIKTGQLLMKPLEGHHGAVRALTTATASSKPLMISGSDDRSLRVWDLETGQHFGAPLRGHDRRVRTLGMIKKDNTTLIVSGSDDQSIRIWNLSNFQHYTQAANATTGPVNAIQATNLMGSGILLASGPDSAIHGWSLTNGSNMIDPIKGHMRRVTSLAICQIGVKMYAVSGSLDKTVRVWDLDNPEASRVLQDHYCRIWAIACTKIVGKSVIMTGGEDSRVRAWDILSGNSFWSPGQGQGHRGRITSLTTTVFRGSPVAISGGADKTVRMWNVANGHPCMAPFEGHDMWIQVVAAIHLENHCFIVSGGDDTTVRIWDPDGKSFGKTLKGHTGPVKALAIGQVKNVFIIASGGDDKVVKLWNLFTGELITDIWVGSSITCMCLYHDSVLVGSIDGLVKITIEHQLV